MLFPEVSHPFLLYSFLLCLNQVYSGLFVFTTTPAGREKVVCFTILSTTTSSHGSGTSSHGSGTCTYNYKGGTHASTYSGETQT